MSILELVRETRKMITKKSVVIALAAVTCLLCALFLVWFFTLRSTGPIPRQYRKGLEFSLYYPSKLPTGYTVDGASFQRQDKVLIFSINAPNGKNIAVSEQAVPAGGVPQKSSPAPFQIPGEKNFPIAIGQAHVSLWGDKYVGDISTTDGTWIIVNVTGFTTDQAAAILGTFLKI